MSGDTFHVKQIDVYASQPNYWRHLAPIARELGRRGHDLACWSTRDNRPWGPHLRHRRQRAPLALCASWLDAQRLSSQRTIYVEHGAGQSYVGDPHGYAGAAGLDHVVLFIGPGEHVADRWRARYGARAVSVGCPALDQYLQTLGNDHDDEDEQDEQRNEDHANSVSRSRYNEREAPGASDRHPADGLRLRGVPVVAVTSHWRCGIAPETYPALSSYHSALRALCGGTSVQLVGHAHPRDERRQSGVWEALGVRYEPDVDTVLRTADLLVADNTSLMYEAAALGIPVLALNGPHYRRDVEHGLRFWSHVPGLQCDDPLEIHSLIDRALEDPPEAKELRARAATHVYDHRDGSSARRAVDAIEQVI